MVKTDLFILLGVMAAVGTVLYFSWVCLRDLVNFISDWWQSREIGDMKAERLAQQDAAREENSRRLDNGCEHVFDTLFGSLPPDVCSKCGLAKETPPGDCDHVWRRQKGLVPASQCEKCGKTYGGSLAEQAAAKGQLTS